MSKHYKEYTKSEKISEGEFKSNIFNVNYFITYDSDIKDLLKNIEKNSDPRNFKEALLRINQLYYDGLIELEKQENWEEQEEILKKLINTSSEFIGQFYRNFNYVPIKKTREIILPLEESLIKYSSKLKAKPRHLSGEECNIRDFANNLEEKLKHENIDLIIPIMSGGFEPAALLKDWLAIDQFLPIRYSSRTKKDDSVLVPALAPEDYIKEQIKGKNILLIDDIKASGKTLHDVNQFLKQNFPKKIRCEIVKP
ncbi:MAG: phosphoribosyltransferase [Nanoarchaeota archaeon]|nr:phosphoribosyltransferase [Nanoarchaeota archaeon]